MTRREMFERMGQTAIAGGMVGLPAANSAAPQAGADAQSIPPDQLPGTEPLVLQGDLAAQMVEGLHQYLARQTAASVEKRQALWQRDYSSHQAYASSVEANRHRFRQIIGLMDERVADPTPIENASSGSSVVGVGDGYKVYSVRWPVLDGVEAEGLMLAPAGTPAARVVALPDADWSPEMLTGLAPGVPAASQFARRLAEHGCLVLVPTLVNRADTWSCNPAVGKFTNITHREYIYRMAYELGRHIIGYEVQKVLAAVDWFVRSQPARPVGVMGYGEGGLVALYSAAADPRIDVACVSGYFQPREGLWEDPLYRNVWTLLHEFGDAEIAGLVAPRGLVIEASRGPENSGPSPTPMNKAAQAETAEHRFDAAASGRLVSPALSEVKAEVTRSQAIFEKLNASDRLVLAVSAEGQGEPGSEQALEAFLHVAGVRGGLKQKGAAPRDVRVNFDPTPRLHRQFRQLVDFTQRQVIACESVRTKFWAKADESSVLKWQESTESYKRYFWEEVLGKLPEPSEPLTAQTRKIYDQPNWTGYEVLLPLWPEVFAYGVLLLPKRIPEGDRRPVVVCQHGLEGRPQGMIFGRDIAANLADHGFITYCPQNPYIGGDKFRKVQRLANPLKLSLFSFILSQHQRTLDWLGQQPFVDSKHMAFYGISYGGKTALRVPPLLDGYCMSICAGDFNEWIWKVCREDAPLTYVFTIEYEIPEFNLGNTLNHSDMANLMTPRPFMVERGHEDPVGYDWWVAYEYAKVRLHYDTLWLSDRTRIEYFNGPHTIHGVGTVEFLHRFLEFGEPIPR